jgi:hypothetical protein
MRAAIATHNQIGANVIEFTRRFLYGFKRVRVVEIQQL